LGCGRDVRSECGSSPNPTLMTVEVWKGEMKCRLISFEWTAGRRLDWQMSFAHKFCRIWVQYVIRRQ
jgi:hypothetical protein